MKRKNRRKRIVATAGAAILALHMMACGGTGEESSSSTGDSGQSTQENNTDAQTDGVEEVTLDIFIDSAGENPMTAGIQEDPVAQYI